MTKKTISKEMENNIKKYEDKIKNLEFPDSIRYNIGMYIGGDGNKGFLNMIREVFQNCFDEIMRSTRGKSPCSLIKVYYDERTCEVMIEDDGQGVPFSKIVDVYTNTHTSANYDKDPYEYTSGKHGLGAKITNALSDKFSAEAYRLGEAKRVEFDNGRLTKKGILDIKCDGRQGTRVSFHPSIELMGEINLRCEEILDMMKGIIFLGKKGKIVEFHGITISGKKFITDLVNENGILSDIFNRVESPLISPIIITHDDGNSRAEIALTYDLDNLSGLESITSYANYSPTTNGTHVRGLLDGICHFFSGYMNKVYLANTSKSNKKAKPIVVTYTDVKSGLAGIISTCSLYPVFGGQAKDTIENKELYTFVKELVISQLAVWCKSKPNDLNKICSFIKGNAKQRINSEKEKIKIGSKYKSDSLSHGLPSKYVRPTGKEDLEFIIVEGDSALGSARNTRCKARQGILPIRGKMPNIFKMTSSNRSKYFNNEEIQGIINIVSDGTGKYGKDFMPSDTKYSKIIIMSDGDTDGDHIATLVLKIFMILYPRLVEAGMIHRAIAPLYGMKNSKGEVDRFFTRRVDFTDWLYNNFSKNYKIEKLDKTKLAPVLAKEILYKNSDYTYDMTVFSNRYAIDIILLEQIIFNIVDAEKNKKDLFKFMKKSIESDKRFRFIKIEQLANKAISIKGEFNELNQTVILNETFLTDLEPLIHHVFSNSIKSFIVNGIVCSLYELMIAFEKSAPKNIVRYKGLGEMNGKDLSRSTLHPDKDRTLIQYTFESASAAITQMRYLEADKNRLLVGLSNNREALIG